MPSVISMTFRTAWCIALTVGVSPCSSPFAICSVSAAWMEGCVLRGCFALPSGSSVLFVSLASLQKLVEGRVFFIVSLVVLIKTSTHIKCDVILFLLTLSVLLLCRLPSVIQLPQWTFALSCNKENKKYLFINFSLKMYF